MAECKEERREDEEEERKGEMEIREAFDFPLELVIQILSFCAYSDINGVCLRWQAFDAVDDEGEAVERGPAD